MGTANSALGNEFVGGTDGAQPSARSKIPSLSSSRSVQSGTPSPSVSKICKQNKIGKAGLLNTPPDITTVLVGLLLEYSGVKTETFAVGLFVITIV
ncbi:hypothetical protein MCERE19_03292 [Spirosomataceae bacterium]